MQHWNHKLWVLVGLLVFLGCITNSSGSFRRPTKVGLVCCEAVSRLPIPLDKVLIGYKYQNALTPCVEAIIFFTEKEKFCSDPNARWIPRRKKDLQEFKD